jgi:hypothetical protein
MLTGLQILALIAMTCLTGWSEIPSAARGHRSPLQILQTEHQPAPADTLKECEDETIADKAVALDDEDCKDDQRRAPSEPVSPEPQKSHGLEKNRLEIAALSSQADKHPRIFVFCSLNI